MWQSLEILNVFTNLSLKQVFWKTKAFYKKLEYHFLVLSTETESALFLHKTACQKPMLREIEWEVQNGPITKDVVLPVTTLFLWKFYSRLGTSSKEFIRYTNYSNVHIHTFRMCWSFIWRCLFPVGILKLTTFLILRI